MGPSIHFATRRKTPVGQPSLKFKDAAEELLDEIDDFALVASTVVRSQVMRSKSNSLKAVPFQPLKDLSGVSYSATLAKFFAFARIFFNNEKNLKDLVCQALTEKCSASSPACLESFVLCLAHVAPNHNNADQLQHAAMHVRRVLRGCAMLHLQGNPDVDMGSFCEEFLNMIKPSPFGVLSVMYHEVKRCVPHDKSLPSRAQKACQCTDAASGPKTSFTSRSSSGLVIYICIYIYILRYKLYLRNALFALDNTVALQESWQRYSETEKELATWLMCGNLNAIFDLFAETTATTSHSEMDIADLSVSFIEHRRGPAWLPDMLLNMVCDIVFFKFDSCTT